MRSNTSFRIAFLMSTMHSMDPFLSPCDQIDSSVCSDTNHEAFRPVFSTFTMLLVDMDLPLNLKVMETVYTLTASALYGLTFFIFLNSFLPSFLQSQALLVLPFFTTLPEEPLGELQEALDALVASHFPMQSDEFAKGSLHRNNYMDCIRKVKAAR